MAKLSKSEANDFKINNIIRLFLYLAFIITGGVLYAKSYLKIDAITTFLGVLFIVAGVIVVYISGKEKKITLSNYDFYFGVLEALCGLLLIINIGNINNYLTFYFGLFLIINACQKSVVAIKLFKKDDDTKVLTLVTSIIIFALGILIMFNPFGQMPLTQLCGIFILFFGLLEFSNTVLLNSKEEEFIKKNK